MGLGPGPLDSPPRAAQPLVRVEARLGRMEPGWQDTTRYAYGVAPLVWLVAASLEETP